MDLGLQVLRGVILYGYEFNPIVYMFHDSEKES